MVRFSTRGFAPAPLLAAALMAQAQPTQRTGRPDPIDANARVPSVAYESAFTAYRRLSDEKLISWREANDTVTRIGGWRVYAREAQVPDPAPVLAPVLAPAPAPIPPVSPGAVR